MRLLITQKQYTTIIKENFDISDDDMEMLRARALKEYYKVQKKIQSLEEEQKIANNFFEKMLPNIDKYFSPAEYNVQGVIDHFTNIKNYTTSELKVLKAKTMQSLLDDEIELYLQEKERIKEREGKEISKENLYDLINTALEGGSNYWYHIEHLPSSLIYDIEATGKPFADAVTDYVFDGNSINFYDAEDDDFLGSLTMDNILDAISILKKDYPNYYDDIIDDNWDAETADVFLQLAVLGEITFG